MAVYLMLTTLTDQGRRTLKENPERIRVVNKEVEAMGAKILSQYATLGIYDFVNLIEASDNETMLKVATEFGARGTIQVMTLPALTIDQFISKLKG